MRGRDTQGALKARRFAGLVLMVVICMKMETKHELRQQEDSSQQGDTDAEAHPFGVTLVPD